MGANSAMKRSARYCAEHTGRHRRRRITYTDTSGNVWAKDGLYGTWYKEDGPVSQYAASGFNTW
jgi:hypothetical protein